MMFPKPKKISKTEKLKLRAAKKRATKLKNKQKTKTYWIKKLDKLIGDLCRERGACENPNCQFRGKGYALQWAHVVSRSYHGTRWDLDNCFCLCAGCHKYYTDRPLEWEAFVEKTIGEGEYHDLKQRALKHPKLSACELEERFYKEKGIFNPYLYDNQP